MSLYLVEITPAEGTNGKLADVLSNVEKIVIRNTDNDSLRFKVFGENKIGFIAKGDEPHKVLDDLNRLVGGAVNMKTIPIRTYDSFAETILGLDKSICVPKTTAFEKPQKLLFAHITVDFQGIGMDDFLKIWKEEAGGGFGARAAGQLDFRAFKTIASRNILMITNLPAAELLDNSSVQLPFAKNPATATGFKFPTVREVKPF